MQNLSLFIRLRNIFGLLSNKLYHLDGKDNFIINNSKTRNIRQGDVKDMFDSKQNLTVLYDDIQ